VISFNRSIKSINLPVGLAFLEGPVILVLVLVFFFFPNKFLGLEGGNRYLELERTVVGSFLMFVLETRNH
jgi:hypothetical protein